MIQPPLKLFIYLAALFFLLSVSLPASGADALSPSPDAASLFLNGTTFQDADGDSFFSAGEMGLANRTIRLILGGKEISNTTTNESGQYLFANLSPGRYVLRADPFSGWNRTAPGAGRYEVTLSDQPGFGLDYGFFSSSNLAASLPARQYPLMRPTREEAGLWAGQYNASAKVYLSPDIAAKIAAAPVASVNLLGRLKYTPSERDQGRCGNCWAWAGTGVMEIDYARQKGTSERLSLQYLDSNYNGACCGGWLTGLASFYRAKGIMVPWSNANAYYRDGSTGCGACSPVSASSISTDPHYDLTTISTSTVPSHGLAKETAISNIKNVLLQGKAIWFAYYLPDSSAWSNFFSFWSAQPETAVWQPDYACGRSYNYQSGGGHAVLCVGYDDTNPNNRYWIMLNSWGTTAGRPAGLFRVNMDMNYDCSCTGLGYVFYWMTLDMSYQGIKNNPPQKPAKPQGTAAGIVQRSYSYTASAIDPDGDDVQLTFDWGDASTSVTKFAKFAEKISLSHAWQKTGTYYVRAKATDSKGGQSAWSTSLAVKITANTPPKNPSAPVGVASGYVGKSYSFKGYTTDLNKDQIFYTFDWGDGSTSQTDLVNSGTSVRVSHTWSLAGTYLVRVMATDSNEAASLWSTSKTVKIYNASRRSLASLSLAAKTEKAGQGKKTCPCSK
ncbi:MAG: PKD domain-containing protein [Methanothrix sp.]|nr:PKD domain-containing protein [Methanothrix sp.]